MIPYSRQVIDKNDLSAVTKVLKSDLITQGPIVKRFEKAVAKKVGAKYAYALNSATSALHISCLALGLNDKHYLWTVPNSFVASANCGLHCGAKVDFVDIDPNTYNICTKHLETKLKLAKKNKALPRILVTVDFAGQPSDQEIIKKLSKRYGFFVIVDASHSLGATRNGKKVGSNLYSDITVFSFHPVKIITSAEGGMALTQDKKIGEKIDILRTHGISRNYKIFKNKINEPWYYEQLLLGFNYRMSEIHAALGLSQLKKLSNNVKQRNLIAGRYETLLKNLPIILPKIKIGNYSSFHLYVIRLDLKKIKKGYSSIFNFLRANKIGVNLHYLPIHLQPIYRKRGFKKGDFPFAEKHSKEAISLPIYPGLSLKQQKYVCKKLIESIS